MIESIGFFAGKPIGSMEKDELLNVIRYLSRRVKILEETSNSYREHVNWATYLSEGSNRMEVVR